MGIRGIVGIIVAILLAASVLIPITSSLSSGQDNLNVVVIAGQSNGAYMETTTVGDVTNVICDPEDVNGEVPLPTAGAFYYGTASVPILYGAYYANPTYDSTLASYDIYPMVSDGEWVIGGEEAAIASELTHRTNSNVLIINVCAPGAPISWFKPTATGGLYAAAVIADALDKVDSGYKITKLGYVWIQGESDKTTAVSTYVSDFDTVNEWYNDNGFGMCYMVQTKPENSGNATAAQTQICNTHSNVILASTAPATFTMANGLMVSDNLHYSQEGRNIVGKDVGEKIRATIYPDDTESDLLSIIPILVIAGLIIAIIGSMIMRREV